MSVNAKQKRQQEKPARSKERKTGTDARDESNNKRPRVEPEVHVYN